MFFILKPWDINNSFSLKKKKGLIGVGQRELHWNHSEWPHKVTPHSSQAKESKSTKIY